MGATPKRSSDTSYYHISNGNFAKTVKADTEGAVKRYSEKKKQDVYELLFEDVSGTIKKMYIEEKSFEASKKTKQLAIVLDDVGLTDIISMPVDGKDFRHFCAKIGNVKLTEPVKFKPYNFEDKDQPGKKVRGLNLFQGPGIDPKADKVAWFFTKEKPGDCPQPTAEKMSDADYKIYMIKLTEFFENYIASFNMGKGSALTATPSVLKTENTTAENTVASGGENFPETDDLPF